MPRVRNMKPILLVINLLRYPNHVMWHHYPFQVPNALRIMLVLDITGCLTSTSVSSRWRPWLLFQFAPIKNLANPLTMVQRVKKHFFFSSEEMYCEIKENSLSKYYSNGVFVCTHLHIYNLIIKWFLKILIPNWTNWFASDSLINYSLSQISSFFSCGTIGISSPLITGGRFNKDVRY